jgi:hypothetical protein
MTDIQIIYFMPAHARMQYRDRLSDVPPVDKTRLSP